MNFKLFQRGKENSDMSNANVLDRTQQIFFLVGKLLPNRLVPELEHLIDVNQSAFIKKRSIHDNFKFVELAAKALHKNYVSFYLRK